MGKVIDFIKSNKFEPPVQQVIQREVTDPPIIKYALIGIPLPHSVGRLPSPEKAKLLRTVLDIPDNIVISFDSMATMVEGVYQDMMFIYPDDVRREDIDSGLVGIKVGNFETNPDLLMITAIFPYQALIDEITVLRGIKK